jgi:hypothetical protein
VKIALTKSPRRFGKFTLRKSPYGKLRLTSDKLPRPEKVPGIWSPLALIFLEREQGENVISADFRI